MSIYIRESLLVRKLLNPYLKECFFWTSSQNADEINSFTSNLKKLVVDISSRNPHFTLITRDFNETTISMSELS